MRRVIAVSCALAASMSLAACSKDDSAPADKSDGVVHLALGTNDNGDLVLKGTMTNPDFLGVYPNPDKWSSIDYYLGDDLVPVAVCKRDGVAKRCTETPFFVEIKAAGGITAPPAAGGDVGLRTYGTPAPAPSGSGSGDSSSPPAGDSTAPPAGDSSSPPPPASAPAPSPPPDSGVTAVVTDVNGTKVAEKTVPPASSAPAPAPSGSGAGAGTGELPPAQSTCGDTAAMGGSPGTGGFSKQGETAACQSASLADTPGCDMTTVAAAAKVYCDAVNAQLAAGQKIDCSVLTSASYTPSALPATKSGGDCETYWGPAATTTTSQYGSCEKVTLLMSQWRDRARHELISKGVCASSPIILDLDGDGVHLSSLDQGVSFDLLGTGQKVRSAWTDGKDAFLALDRNANGVIDGASELFGNGTEGGTYADGFAALADLDDDGNGVIDAKDRAFGHLVVWRDADRDGVSQPSELTSLRDAGVRWVSVTAERHPRATSLDAHGNEIPLVAEFGRRDGTRGALVDAFLRYKPIK